MAKQKLPINIHSFREIREGGYYYADKTAHVARLLDEGAPHHLLSRPPRFGKTLLIDTLQELFEGNEKLFRGLAIYDEWDWTVKHPVLRLGFSNTTIANLDQLKQNFAAQLDVLGKKFRVSTEALTASGRLQRLIEEMHEKTGQRVVVLIDDYDKPILDVLGNPELAEAIHQHLVGIYSNTKECDGDIHFSFLTGVSKTLLLSPSGGGANQLNHITTGSRYSSICGFTDHDLDTVFAPEIEGLDREQIREWHGGYSWGGEEKLYAPHTILQLLAEREFKARWFEDCTPGFLVDAMKRPRAAGFQSIIATYLMGVLYPNDADLPEPEGLIVDDMMLSIHDVKKLDIPTLLFQAGYLAIMERFQTSRGVSCRLDYPNRDVRESRRKLPWDVREPEAAPEPPAAPRLVH